MATKSKIDEIMNIVTRWISDNEYDEVWGDAKEIEKSIQDLRKRFEDSTKKYKDPDMPKKGKTAFLFFAEDERVIIKQQFPEMKGAGVIMSELGIRWKKLQESTKVADKNRIKKYEKLSLEDKMRNAEEMKNYVKLSDDEIRAKCIARDSTKKPRKARKPKISGELEKPKKSRTAYIFFCTDMRSKVSKNMEEKRGEKIQPREITTILGSLWTEYKVEEKYKAQYKMYQKQADEDKMRYQNELEQFIANGGVVTPSKKSPKKSKSEVSKLIVLPEIHESEKEESEKENETSSEKGIGTESEQSENETESESEKEPEKPKRRSGRNQEKPTPNYVTKRKYTRKPK